MLHVSLCRFFFFFLNELLSMPQLNNYGGTQVIYMRSVFQV